MTPLERANARRMKKRARRSRQAAREAAREVVSQMSDKDLYRMALRELKGLSAEEIARVQELLAKAAPK